MLEIRRINVRLPPGNANPAPARDQAELGAGRLSGFIPRSLLAQRHTIARKGNFTAHIMSIIYYCLIITLIFLTIGCATDLGAGNFTRAGFSESVTCAA